LEPCPVTGGEGTEVLVGCVEDVADGVAVADALGSVVALGVAVADALGFVVGVGVGVSQVGTVKDFIVLWSPTTSTVQSPGPMWSFFVASTVRVTIGLSGWRLSKWNGLASSVPPCLKSRTPLGWSVYQCPLSSAVTVTV